MISLYKVQSKDKKIEKAPTNEPLVHIWEQKGESGQRKDIKVKTKFLMLLLFKN